ncbi:Lysosome membrane protein 2-like protein, partial [Dinothrombium tinctorium]
MNRTRAGKLAVFGGALFLIGTFFTFSLSKIVELGVRHLQQLRYGSDMFYKWIELPIPLTIQFYLFEVMNPMAVINGAKPVVRERGPYTFWEYRKKEIIEYSSDGTKVSYWETKTYYFDPSRSVGSIDEKITVINAPMVAIGDFVSKLTSERMSALTLGVLNTLFAVYRTNLFIQKSPREIIFDGYRVRELDTLLTLAKPIEALNILQIPRPLPNNTFGLFYNRNGTPEAFYEVYTGTGGFSDKFAYLISYRGKNKLNFWNSEYCNMINGTDGVQYQPYITKQDRLYFFAFDLCRSIYLTYESDSEVQGIPTYRFTPPDELFQGPHKNPDNMCFCPYPKTPQKCYLDGVLDISACWAGAPIILSNPHYLYASKEIQDSVVGLKPNADIHLSALHIEPRVGAILKANRRLQVSVKLERVPFLRQMRNIRKEGIIPLLWLDESAEIDDALRQEINFKLIYPTKLGHASFPAMMVAGLVIFFVSGIAYFYRRQESVKVNSQSIV